MSAPVPHPTQGPPVPPSKPVLSSPGSYMSSYAPAGTASTTPTAGIHSVNKSHEKPAIAARPIPPPTLPKYSSSFSKVDRDRNEFTSKIDRAEREKVYRPSFYYSVFFYHFYFIIITSHLTIFIIRSYLRT